MEYDAVKAKSNTVRHHRTMFLSATDHVWQMTLVVLATLVCASKHYDICMTKLPNSAFLTRYPQSVHTHPELKAAGRRGKKKSKGHVR